MLNNKLDKIEIIKRIKPETLKQRADKNRMIKEGFYSLKHKDYNGKNIKHMFAVYLKYANEFKMTQNDFIDLCYFTTSIHTKDINRLWHRARGSQCMAVQDFLMFKNEIQRLINKERTERSKELKMSNIKHDIKITIDNMDIKPNFRKCGFGFIAEFEHNGQLINAYGNTKDSAISMLNRQILKLNMNDYDLIGDDFNRLYDYVDEVVGCL